MIRAAGGVLWRRRDDGDAVQVAVVHRLRYDDWSLPKGKARSGESLLRAAVREVREETGFRARIDQRLHRAHYLVDGAAKQVQYYAMRLLDGQFEESDEVDRIRWVSTGEALSIVHYDSDRAALMQFAATAPITSTVVLVRHAHAGNRQKWHGPDDLRPLTSRGWREAVALAGDLAAFGPQRLLSAAPVRCVQTVQPLANETGLEVEPCEWAADDSFLRSPWPTVGGLAMLVATGQTCVISSQGDTIPGVLRVIDAPVADYGTAKGGFWALCFSGTDLVSVDEYSPQAHDRTSGITAR